MKVLHILPSISPKLGGPTQVALNLVKKLREQGVQAEIATTDDDNGGRLSELDKKSEVYQGITIYFFRASVFRLRQYIISLGMLIWLWKNCKRYDLLDIHYFFTFSGTAASLIARFKGVPYSVRPMGQLTEWSINYKKLRKKIYWYLFDRHMLKNASFAQCTSVVEANEIRNLCGAGVKCIVLPLGAEEWDKIQSASDKLRAEYDMPHDANVVLYMSRLHEKKRPEHLIDAFSRIEGHSNTYLIFAGEGEDAFVAKLKNQALQSGLSPRIRFLGFVYGNQKALLLQGSDFFVLPSYSENFGIAVAEALINSLPVIITENIQIAPLISEANAGIVVNNQVDSLSSAMRELLENKELRLKLSRNAKSMALKNFSWEKAALELKEAYSEISI